MSRPLSHELGLALLLAALLLPACRPIEPGQGDGAGAVLPRPHPQAADLGETGQSWTDFQLPSDLRICGERIPVDRPSVRERLEYEFLLIVHHPSQVELWRRRALRYFPLIEASLRQAGLPDDLKYLAVAESDLRPLAVSPAGAAGLWQFIPSTARTFGVDVSRNEDQRFLPEILLPAGMKFLAQLNRNLGSWPLAMAAYNAGQGRISGAMASQGVREYWDLNLTRETERYVYRIAAIKFAMEGAPAYGFNSRPPAGLYAPGAYDQETVTFPAGTTWPALAARYGVAYKELKLLNPHLAGREVLSGGPYIFRTPKKSV